MNDLIFQAIKERRLLEFIYDGGRRVVEPHCYGVSTAGNPSLRAFQVVGQSLSGNPIAMKMFNLSKASNFKILPEVFQNERDVYRKGDKGMSVIHIEL